jgi:transposase-like protein
MRKLLKKQGFAPKLLVTDKLGSYGSAFRQLRLTCPHDRGPRKNNRAENSHQVQQQSSCRAYHCSGGAFASAGGKDR